VRRRRPAAPPRRWRRGAWRDASYLALDFETTGLDLAQDRVVSFGAVPIRGGAVDLAGARHRLVDPGDRTPSRTSVEIHGIRPVDLERALPASDAAALLARLLDRRFLLAWYAVVEQSFLGSLLGVPVASWVRRTIDVRDLLILLEGPDAARWSLSHAAATCGVPVADPHHALDDALVTAQLFLVLARRLDAREGERTVEDLLRVSAAARGPA
jgi:DNA polymerase-3 subunit epsilon